MATRKKRVHIIIHTRDMDSLDVDVFASTEAAVGRAIGLLEPGDAAEDGGDVEAALKAWNGVDDLDVWENEGRVAMSLRCKLVHTEA